MAITIKLKRGSTADHSGYVGAQSELTHDIEANHLH